MEGEQKWVKSEWVEVGGGWVGGWEWVEVGCGCGEEVGVWVGDGGEGWVKTEWVEATLRSYPCHFTCSRNESPSLPTPSTTAAIAY